MNNAELDWVLKKYFEEHCQNLRHSWDLYIKFYTVFLTINIVCLGATVQHISQGNRWPIVFTFIIQNLISTITAILFGRNTKSTASKVTNVAKAIIKSEQERIDATELKEIIDSGPIPSQLGIWAGWANAASHIALIFCWCAVLFIKKHI